jgi:glutaredoxin
VIKIYGKVNCAWCRDAKKLAESYSLEYEYVDVGYTDGLRELQSLLPEAKTVPQIWWHGRHVGGYQEFAQEVENTLGGFAEQKL